MAASEAEANSARGNKSVASEKWRVLLLLSLAELLAMATWFSATAVVPALTESWSLGDNGRAWLTMSVQIGFVAGAFGSAILNLADRIPARPFLATSALLAGLATLAIPLVSDGLIPALVLRFATGVFLAGVYPVGMKIMATWTQRDRGLAIGLLVGALTIGSASPHLINAFGGVQEWQPVLYLAGASSLLGALLALLFAREGPYKTQTPPFKWKEVGLILRARPVMLANIGYLGHMWELYAMWSWIPLFFLDSFSAVGVAPVWSSVAAFAVIASGGLGSLMAGRWADRLGRTTVTIASMLVSGACALTIGFFFGGNPLLLTGIGLLWGFTVVADSAQFSAAVTELADRAYLGTALTLQTSLGFLLTLFTIRMIPPLEAQLGWRYAFVALAIGPVAGIVAMWRLRRSEASVQLAGGRRCRRPPNSVEKG
ncbi:MAG: MFS transporter, partial [Caldilineaceae bacterium]|nr:MFS transporter [Caldilineaceae bacterium]